MTTSVTCYICNEQVSLKGRTLEHHLRAHSSAEMALAHARERLNKKHYIDATVSEESVKASEAKPGDVVSLDELPPAPTFYTDVKRTTLPEVMTSPMPRGCFNCRQKRHEKCAFSPALCPCSANGHKDGRDGEEA